MDIQRQLNELKNQIIELQKNNDVLQEKYNTLEQKYSVLLDTKNEIYYQKFLERKMLATHHKTVFGITDITTKNEHIEIKHWRNYKSALGQLLSYNFYDNKNLCAYFFGTVTEKQCNSIIELYKSKGVSIKQFIDTPEGIEIKTILDTNKENNENKKKDEFLLWLETNVEYKDNSILKLKDICEKFLNKSNTHSKESSKYKMQVEYWIKLKYPNINNIMQHSTYKGVNFKGWLHLGFNKN